MALHIRSATPDDFGSFSRLFPELGTPEPAPSAERFAADFGPTTLIAEQDGQAVGYAFFRVMKEAVHVSHLVTAPDARRRGVARALMAEVARRARADGCTAMQLHVLPENAAAIRLYEGLGLERRYTSRAIRLAWSLVDRLAPTDVALATLARPIEPADDARLERDWELPSGTLAEQRARPNRVLRMIPGSNGRSALAVFDLGFPGASPFCAPDRLHALSLLRALRPSAPDDPAIVLALGNQAELATALLEQDATVHMETVFMRGPLP